MLVREQFQQNDHSQMHWSWSVLSREGRHADGNLLLWGSTSSPARNMADVLRGANASSPSWRRRLCLRLRRQHARREPCGLMNSWAKPCQGLRTTTFRTPHSQLFVLQTIWDDIYRDIWTQRPLRLSFFTLISYQGRTVPISQKIFDLSFAIKS